MAATKLEVSRFERDGTMATPYVWVYGSTPGRFESVLAADPQIRSVEPIERCSAVTLFKLHWEVDSPLIECVVVANGKVVEAVGTVDEWQLKIWFEKQTDASTFQTRCAAMDVPLSIDQLKSLADSVTDTDKPLSDPQRQTLAIAHREGYFEEPREVTQEEIAAEIGISSSAVGGRLRRGMSNLVEEILNR